MSLTCGIITVSDKGAQGLREDTAGPACGEIAQKNQWKVCHQSIVPDERQWIEKELKIYSDQYQVDLIITTGGTGFSKRDVTPEATLAVCTKLIPGIPEFLRRKSTEITPMGMLSRGVAGIRGSSVIVNLPGSEKAARECMEWMMIPLKHGVEVLKGSATECANLYK